MIQHPFDAGLVIKAFLTDTSVITDLTVGIHDPVL